MRVLEAIFVALLPSLSLASFADCKNDLKNRSMFILPPRSERLLLGMMVEGQEPGQFAMAFGNYYLAQHADLYLALTKFHPNAQIRWAGEVRLKNPRFSTAHGVIDATLSTSGYAWSLLQMPGDRHRNDPQLYGRVLSERLPHLVTPSTKHLKYTRQYAHFDPYFRYLKLSGSLNVNGREESVRHVYRDMLGPVIYFFEMLVNEGGVLSEEAWFSWIAKHDNQKIERYSLTFVHALRHLHIPVEPNYASWLTDYIRRLDKWDPDDPSLKDLGDKFRALIRRLELESGVTPEIINASTANESYIMFSSF